MARLLTIVNERKKLRTEYRKHLEDEYIAEEKKKEKEAYLVLRAEMVAKGVKMPPTEEESHAHYLIKQ